MVVVGGGGWLQQSTALNTKFFYFSIFYFLLSSILSLYDQCTELFIFETVLLSSSAEDLFDVDVLLTVLIIRLRVTLADAKAIYQQEP